MADPIAKSTTTESNTQYLRGQIWRLFFAVRSLPVATLPKICGLRSLPSDPISINMQCATTIPHWAPHARAPMRGSHHLPVRIPPMVGSHHLPGHIPEARQKQQIHNGVIRGSAAYRKEPRPNRFRRGRHHASNRRTIQGRGRLTKKRWCVTPAARSV